MRAGIWCRGAKLNLYKSFNDSSLEDLACINVIHVQDPIHRLASGPLAFISWLIQVETLQRSSGLDDPNPVFQESILSHLIEDSQSAWTSCYSCVVSMYIICAHACVCSQWNRAWDWADIHSNRGVWSRGHVTRLMGRFSSKVYTMWFKWVFGTTHNGKVGYSISCV